MTDLRVPPATEERLQALVERDVRDWPQMPGRLLRVLSPEIDFEVAAGVRDRSTGEPLEAGSRFRIASVTKSFVAAATLRLVEEGMLGLAATIDELLGEAAIALLREGGYRPEAITLRHLLTHTSGIYDFAADSYDPGITGGFNSVIARDPQHRWTRLEQIRFAMEHGTPYGEPGEVYAYSDTGACLVGEILERVTGGTMGAALRELVGFERLGLASTYHESVDAEPRDLPPLAHIYEGEVDVSGYDASVDLWGGGGLVSTCADLARFFRALLRGEIFQRPETLELMCATSAGVRPLEPSPTAEADPTSDPADAALFLYRTEIAGENFWGHGGFWGTAAYTCPRLDITVVAQHGQAHMPDGFDRQAIFADVAQLLD